jgi:hypothetical protein
MALTKGFVDGRWQFSLVELSVLGFTDAKNAIVLVPA